ncbi:MAG: ATP-grasp domain-containing protein [Anaerolineaceae bacterium]|nr:ATP-grasp domain-containing protein [Anaerolineaceae bacterium]
MKSILFIGAGFLQAFIIKRAMELGYRTISIDKNPKSVGFKFADEHEVVDIIDVDACLAYAHKKNIDGVLTAATDYGVLSASKIANEFNLPGLDFNVANVIKNKYSVRKILYQHSIETISQFFEVSCLEDLRELRHKINYPVMVKPCDGSGSKSTQRVDDFETLQTACEDALQASLIGRALIEDFIEGVEFGAESFVYQGHVNVLGVMGKRMTKPPDYAELGHYMPCGLAPEKEDEVKTEIIKTIKALNINFGAVNIDLLITNDLKPIIVDIGARMGGNLIGSHIIPSATGIDYMGNLIKSAVGDEVNMRAKSSISPIATRLLALKPGKVVKLPDFQVISQTHNVEIYHHLQLGDHINQYHNNLDGCGYVLARGKDVIDANLRVEQALRDIDRGIERV